MIKIYIELIFDMKGLSKPLNVLQILLSQVINKIIQFDPDLRILKCKAEVRKSNTGFAADVSLVLKKIHKFIKFIKYYFYEIKIKGNKGRRV